MVAEDPMEDVPHMPDLVNNEERLRDLRKAANYSRNRASELFLDSD
jgi:hypothetical protein